MMQDLRNVLIENNEQKNRRDNYVVESWRFVWTRVEGNGFKVSSLKVKDKREIF